MQKIAKPAAEQSLINAKGMHDALSFSGVLLLPWLILIYT